MNNRQPSRRQLLAAALLSAPGAGATEPAIRISGRDVEITLTAVSAHTARIRVQPLENGTPVPVALDGALVQNDWGKSAARLRTLRSTQTVRCGDLNVQVSASPLNFRIETRTGKLVQEFKLDEGTGQLSFYTGKSLLLGLGQGGPQFNRRGEVDRMNSGQSGFKLATHGAKVPVQLLIGASGWAMFVHQPLGAFDLTGEVGKLMPSSSTPPLPLDVFVIGAQSPAAVMREFAGITGYPEMPPLWSFGYQQSHRTLGPPEEILEEAKLMRRKNLPCDAMIYLGTDFCPNGWNVHNGDFEWNKAAFPDPKQAIESLHRDHFKVVLHTVIEGRHLTGTVNDPCTAAPLPSGRTPDNRWPPDRQVPCYWPVHRQLLDLGIDGWWPDQGDGLDSASRLARNRMYFEGHQKERPNERVYALHRNGYAGMQRFAAFLWSGDVQSSWETLKNHVPIGINTGLSGIPWWGSDIGGFVPGPEYTGEMYVRWFQYAAFTPLFRSHGREWRLHTPWGWNGKGLDGFRETPSYKPDLAELNNPNVEPICRKYLELRYRLMTYLYSAAKVACETGLPIIRAMWLHYPDDAAAVSRGDQYLYGRDILVAPVVEKGATSRTVYLPAGTWYDYWTNERKEGAREVARKVDLETMPLYVRAGAIVPTDPLRQYTSQKVDEPLTLTVYPGADGFGSVYEDDGKSFNFRKGEYTRIEVSWRDRERRIELRLAKGAQILGPPKAINVRVVGRPEIRSTVFGGRPLALVL